MKNKKPHIRFIRAYSNMGKFLPGDWLAYDERAYSIVWYRNETMVKIDGDNKFWWSYTYGSLDSLIRFISAFCGISFECWSGKDFGVRYKRVFVVK